MIRRLYPHPWLSVLLFLTWFGLVNQVKVGSAVMRRPTSPQQRRRGGSGSVGIARHSSMRTPCAAAM